MVALATNAQDVLVDQQFISAYRTQDIRLPIAIEVAMFSGRPSPGVYRSKYTVVLSETKSSPGNSLISLHIIDGDLCGRSPPNVIPDLQSL